MPELMLLILLVRPLTPALISCWPFPIADTELYFLDFRGELSEASLDLLFLEGEKLPLVGEKLSDDILDLMIIQIIFCFLIFFFDSTNLCGTNKQRLIATI